MPIMPAIGLSVIIHGIVIIFHKLTGTRRALVRKVTRSRIIAGNIIGSLIFISIFMVISAGAYRVIQLCLGEQHSSVAIAEDYIAQNTGYKNKAQFAYAAVVANSPDAQFSTLSMTKSPFPLISINNCETCQNNLIK